MAQILPGGEAALFTGRYITDNYDPLIPAHLARLSLSKRLIR
jgi:hypothetical protein